MDLHFFWSFPDLKIEILVIGCVCLTVINIIRKQIPVKTPNLASYLCIVSRYKQKHYMKIGEIVCVQGHKKNSQTLRHYGWDFLLICWL